MRGRKPVAARMKLVRGTTRRDRPRGVVLPPPLEAPVADPPTWLTDEARQL